MEILVDLALVSLLFRVRVFFKGEAIFWRAVCTKLFDHSQQNFFFYHGLDRCYRVYGCVLYAN